MNDHFENFLIKSFDSEFELLFYKEERKRLNIIKTLFNEKSKKYFDIVVDNKNNPRYFSLFFLDDKIGYLSLEDFDSPMGLFLNVKEVLILNTGYRGFGLCQELYLEALKVKSIDGLVSFIPNRIDEKCIPNIYGNFKTKIIDDFEYILKEKNL